MKVILTEPAEADLEDIADFIAQDNAARAESFVAEIIERCLSLGEAPERHVVYARLLHQDIRRCPYGAYLIFYAVEGDNVEITRVIHGARDYARIFFPEED
jgi:toxin ParE1/3/4